MRLLILALLALVAASPAAAACDGRLLESPNVANTPLCIPADPQRIVVLDTYFNLGMGLELGAAIVGAPLFGMSDSGLEKLAAERSVADIGHSGQPSLERIISLKPDLILGDAFMHGRAYETAAKIAPTALVNVQDWRAYYATIADLTGRKGVADAAFAAYEARVAAIRARMPDVKVSVVRIIPGGFQVYLDGPGSYGPFSVLREAGVKRTAYETSTEATVLKRPDWEGLSALDGDILLYIVGGGHDTDPSGRLERETLANPLWQMLPAVQAGRAHELDPVTWMEFSGLGSANRVLDDVERLILAAPDAAPTPAAP
ncbi:iron-siderophore ABC transporter substrate-binding protein [Methylobrevis pamukkalensis]|uniref:Putative siderophore-binding lipoprotein YfiY n=1 Tax=Methylobrevis pamukkalensis TaxID=1439726 RepID=A0A1E3H762_9HYPH|nr:iron-siderophore ABC transporter substrate-binding protein [Methylobrevis pamukkalensis]ODN72160.1 putative siderophore-binding lipoprotein YfiY precursor [Methylobrevis pamukkalensis]